MEDEWDQMWEEGDNEKITLGPAKIKYEFGPKPTESDKHEDKKHFNKQDRFVHSKSDKPLNNPFENEFNQGVFDEAKETNLFEVPIQNTE